MKNLVKNTISVASLFLFLLSGCRSPEKYAEEWCALNQKIINSEGSERDQLVREAASLENEIYQRYNGDPESLRLIEELTDECD